MSAPRATKAELERALSDSTREAAEARDQLAATSEILRAISQSPSDPQPVFDTILRNAVRLCDAVFGNLYRFDGELIHLVAHHNFTPEQLAWWLPRFPRPLGAGRGLARVITHGIPLRIADVDADRDVNFPAETRAMMRAQNVRSYLSVPMLSRDRTIGAITLTHREAGAFSQIHENLLKTFAAQAAIAIENARLFRELEAKNNDLAQSLERQTATSEILRVISSSPTDAQPVFEAIVAAARRLLDGREANLWRLDGDTLHAVAIANADHRGPSQALVDNYVRMGLTPWPLARGGFMVEAIRRAVPMVMDDTESQAVLEATRERARAAGFRSAVYVPLIRDGAIGVIAVAKPEPGGITPELIALLQTFADQAVIAIENVRLFTALQARTAELEDKSRQLEAASQHKSEFLANMSHELRTPLNAIIGFSEVLAEGMFGETNAKQAEYLRDILESGHHLLSLINDILDLSKIEAGRVELETTDFELPLAVDNVLTLVRERAGRRGIALGRAIDEGVGAIRADERKVKQVLLNLLSNALKFTPEGGQIDVGVTVNAGMAEVSVADTGVGIATEDQEAVFEEFRQVGTADKKIEGTGLGLALSKKFVELHGGRIWVTSQLGAGATFTFTLPLRPSG